METLEKDLTVLEALRIFYADILTERQRFTFVKAFNDQCLDNALKDFDLTYSQLYKIMFERNQTDVLFNQLNSFANAQLAIKECGVDFIELVDVFNNFKDKYINCGGFRYLYTNTNNLLIYHSTKEWLESELFQCALSPAVDAYLEATKETFIEYLFEYYSYSYCLDNGAIVLNLIDKINN